MGRDQMTYPFNVYQPTTYTALNRLYDPPKKWLCASCNQECGHAGPRVSREVRSTEKTIYTYKVIGSNDLEYFIECIDTSRDYDRTYLDTLAKEGTYLTYEEAEKVLEGWETDV